MTLTHDPKTESLKGVSTASSCAWTQCLKRPCVAYIAVFMAILAVIGGWVWWSHECAHCRLETLATQVESLQKELDQLNARSQAQDVEGFEQRQNQMAERLGRVEEELHQTQHVLDQTQLKDPAQERTQIFDEVRSQMQNMDTHHARKLKEEVRWVRLALLIQSGQPFASLLERLEPDLKHFNFPSGWVQDMKVWGKEPAPSREVLIAQGHHFMKKYQLWNDHPEESIGSSFLHKAWSWAQCHWRRWFSVHPQHTHGCCASLTLEDLIQRIETFHQKSSEKNAGLEGWLKHAEQRVQLDQAADALWNSLIED